MFLLLSLDMLVAVYHSTMWRKTWSHGAPSPSWGSPGETPEYTWYMLLIPQWYHNYDKIVKLAHVCQACYHTYPTHIIISKMGRVVWGYILKKTSPPTWLEPGMVTNNSSCSRNYLFELHNIVQVNIFIYAQNIWNNIILFMYGFYNPECIYISQTCNTFCFSSWETPRFLISKYFGFDLAHPFSGQLDSLIHHIQDHLHPCNMSILLSYLLYF